MKNLLLYFFLIFIGTSCQNEPAPEAETSTETPVEAKTSTVLEFPLTAFEDCLSDWTAFYQQQTGLENLQFSAFVQGETIKQDSLMTFGPDNILNDEVLKNFALYSPQRTKALDIYSYGTMVEENGGGGWAITAGGPDSEAAIIDLQNPERPRYRLMFCGTPCTYDDACWLDEQHVAIAGLYNESGQNFYPTIWLADLTTNTIQMYSYPTAVETPTPSYVQQHLQRMLQ